jgi:threonine/homoserine/homoserine lactone efflux protein
MQACFGQAPAAQACGGLALFAAPGPINIETLRRVVSRGFFSAFAVQISALAAELLWGGAVLAGIAPLIQAPGTQAALTLIGADGLSMIIVVHGKKMVL